MQVATILPTHFLSLIADRSYHMALAHLIGKDAYYTDFYTEMANAIGDYVILDNGVIETGTPMPIEEIVRRANKIGAQELILPDALDDSNLTLDNACASIPYARKYFKGRLMAVPQGKTLEEWLDCVDLMLSLDIDVIGIPKRLVKIAGRDGRLCALRLLGRKLRGLEIHLLGCWETPIEVTMIEQAVRRGEILPVRGVDSTIPYVYTRDNMLISQGPRPSGAVDFSAKDGNVDMLIKNIKIWEDACNPSKSGKVHQLL